MEKGQGGMDFVGEPSVMSHTGSIMVTWEWKSMKQGGRDEG